LNKRTLFVIGILAACLIVLLIFFMTGKTENNRLLLAEVKETVQAEEHVKYYDIGFKKDVESEQLAGMWVLAEDTGRDFYRISFQITHVDSIKLKSASLKFNNVDPASALMLTTPGAYPMPFMKFESIVPSSGGAILTVDDFGVLETGTVNFEFYLNASGMKPLQNNELNAEISLGLRENRKELLAELPLVIKLP
jgi:hypothetical protein